ISIIEKGFEAYEKQNFKDAIKYYQQVMPGDTNFYLAQYELGLALMVDSQFSKALDVFNFLKENYYEERRQVILNIGSTYSFMEENEKALEYYAAVMKEFPHDNRPYYESAIVY